MRLEVDGGLSGKNHAQGARCRFNGRRLRPTVE
jgi:hypothetical protein